ncbi:PF04286 family protein [Staphylococcus epidermidis VCU057]|nr:PF04286 family protein [Staphylococcus epidermidis VCU057]
MVDYKLTTKFLNKLNFWYESNKYRKLSEILPQSFLDQCKGQIEYITDFLCERARNYLSSEKGERDIYEMLDTFFNEKGRIIGLLQMFMTKESIADRIQHELIRLTQHPQSQKIITKVLNDEYEIFKDKNLDEIIKEQQFKNYSQLVLNELKTYLNLKDKTERPIKQVVPQFIQFLEDDTSKRMTDFIIKGTSKHLTNIMKKINLRQLVEEQINTFDLKYIENLIIDIANKELKLIMTLGFILGGIIGFFQGVIAIFV